MKKLDEIPKNEFFKVPDGYFDQLPNTIQARIARENERKTNPVLNFSLRYALPAFVVVILATVWFSRPPMQQSAEAMLASIETDDLVAYLDNSDVSTEELLDEAGFDGEDLDQIENEVYDLHFNLDEFDIEGNADQNL